MSSRRYPRHLVKLHRAYTVDEAARALSVSRGTVRRWIAIGLPAIQDQRPHLILGRALIQFLADQAPKRQRMLLNECYCLACRTPREPAFGEIEYFPVSVASGNLRALCPVCATVMRKRFAFSQIDALRALATVCVRQAAGHIGDSSPACLNDDFVGGGASHA